MLFVTGIAFGEQGSAFLNEVFAYMIHRARSRRCRLLAKYLCYALKHSAVLELY